MSNLALYTVIHLGRGYRVLKYWFDLCNYHESGRENVKGDWDAYREWMHNHHPLLR